MQKKGGGLSARRLFGEWVFPMNQAGSFAVTVGSKRVADPDVYSERLAQIENGGTAVFPVRVGADMLELDVSEHLVGFAKLVADAGRNISTCLQTVVMASAS